MKKFQLIGASALTLLSAVALAPALAAAPLLPQKGDAEEKEEEKDTYLALVGGDVHTGLGGVLREATILVKNDKVEAFGYDVVVPDDAEVVDVTGMRVYPGLIAVSSLGLFGGGAT